LRKQAILALITRTLANEIAKGIIHARGRVALNTAAL
jgi:hypothetical protein